MRIMRWCTQQYLWVGDDSLYQRAADDSSIPRVSVIATWKTICWLRNCKYEFRMDCQFWTPTALKSHFWCNFGQLKYSVQAIDELAYSWCTESEDVGNRRICKLELILRTQRLRSWGWKLTILVRTPKINHRRIYSLWSWTRDPS
jgi:hypothetical protein